MSDLNLKYHDRIYQLDELILDVNNFVRQKTKKFETQLIDPTNLKNLKMSRFKLTDYDLDLIFEKTKIIYVDDYHTGLKYGGKEIDEIKFKRPGEFYDSNITIVQYENKNSVTDITNPVNVNLILRTLLSDLVVSDKSNNILMPIINVDVMGSDLSSYASVSSMIDNDKYYSVQITEKFSAMITLDSFLKKYPLDLKVLKSILYQIIQVLYQINSTYPNFRNNNLIPETITCYLKGTTPVIPEIKIGSYYLSTITDILPNNYIEKSSVKIPKIDSEYSDLYQMLNFLWNNYNTDISKYPELIAFFDIILPKKIRSTEQYLTTELWDSLTDNEKYDLKIRNIRNHTFFNKKDFLIDATDFIENEISRITSKSSQSSQSSQSISKSQSSQSVTKSKPNLRSKTKSNSRNESDLGAPNSSASANEDIGDIDIDNKEVEYDENSEEDKFIDGILDSIIEEKNETDNSRVESELNTVTFNDGDKSNSESKISISNKKYYNNDIDNMSHKSSRNNNQKRSKDNNNQKRSKDNNNVYSEYGYETEGNEYSEKTEDRHFRRPSQLIVMPDKRSSNPKLKSYHGTRYIGSTDTNLIDDSNNQYNMADIASYQTQNRLPLNNGNANGNATNTVNSIGNLLGASPNDFNNRSSASNYAQLSQQLAQQMAQSPPPSMSTSMPASMTMPQTMQQPMQIPISMPAQQSMMQQYQDPTSYMSSLNLPGQIPQSIQNPQPTIMQQDDAMNRYLMATGQLSNQAGIDTSAYNQMSQINGYQNAQPMAQQMPTMQQLQQMQQMQQMQQTGGNKQRPFFFR